MADFLTDKPAKLERAFLVGVQNADMKPGEAAELASELKELVENLRITVARAEIVNLRRPTPRSSSAAARPRSSSTSPRPRVPT